MPSSSFTRRRVLTLGGLSLAAAFGGCSQSIPGSDEPPRELALSLSPMGGPLRERYVVDLADTSPPWDEKAFDAALDGSTHTTQGHAPFPTRGDEEPTYARRNGTYYHLDSLVVGEETTEHPVLRLFEVGRADDLETPPDRVPHSSLPAADRHAVQIAYFVARARGGGGVPWNLVERGGYVYRNEDAIAASELLSDSGPSHVEYREVIYDVSIASETFHEAIYRADVDPVADSKSEIETILRASILDARLEREDLSAAERDVLARATSDSYRESHPYSEAFRSLLKKLDHRAHLDGDVESDAGVEPPLHRWHLLYDDRYFAYTLRFVSG